MTYYICKFMNILWKYLQEIRLGSKGVCGINVFWEQKKAQKNQANKHVCDCWFQHSHQIVTSRHWPTVRWWRNRYWRKEQRFVELRQQGSLQSHFYIHMQASNPDRGLEKYYFVKTNTNKLSDTMSIQDTTSSLFLSSLSVPFKYCHAIIF